jgi:hydrogenase small subunit
MQFGDEGHRKGYCLYKLGCKGPETYANCPTLGFGDAGESNWPVGCGAPCFGCSEKGVGFTKPIHSMAKMANVAPPLQYPRIDETIGKGSSFASAAALAAIAGAAAGGAAMLAKNLGLSHQAAEQEKKSAQKPKAEV